MLLHSQFKSKSENMLNKKISLKNVLVACGICSSITYIASYRTFKHTSQRTLAAATLPVITPHASCGTVSHRLEGYKYIKPLLYGDKTCESGNYAGLKMQLEDAIKKFKEAGTLDDVSVYLKVFGKGEYMSINENTPFHPGSLIKLPILITFMVMEEKTPGILNKKLLVTVPPGGVPRQTYNSNQVVPGRSYTIKELLKYMVSYSDNNATYVLNNNVDLDAFRKMFSDFGIVVPDVKDMNYTISAKDYSAFLKVVYNAGYLTTANSEYVAELLAECDFKDGIQKGLPVNTPIVHKFGEWGDKHNPEIHQLSESGIIYMDNAPYLLTVMTQGKDVKKLPEVLNKISEITFRNVKEVDVTF